MRRLIWLLSFIAFASPALAVKEYYSLSRSPRALGMGGAYYGLSDDEDALFYNPAGIALFPGGGQFLVSLGSQVSGDAISGSSTVSNAFKGGDISSITSTLGSLAGKPIYGGARLFVSFITRGFAFGVLAADAKADVAVLGRDLDTTLDATAIGDAGVFLAKAGHIAGNLYAGVTAKLLARGGGRKEFNIVDIAGGTKFVMKDIGGAGMGFDGDLGLTYLLGKPGGRVSGGVSLAVNNVVATKYDIGRSTDAGPPPQLPRMVSLGGYAVLGGAKSFLDNLRLALDIAELNLDGQPDPNLGRREGDLFKHVNLGAELPLGGWLAVRAGFHQGDWTAGLGLHAKALKIDFATYAEELYGGLGRLTSRRYVLQLALGFGVPDTGATVSATPTRASSSRRSE